MKLWNQDLYIKAWNFAARAHLGQKVPGTSLPYINHIGSVAMEVMTAIAQTNTVEDPDLAVQCALLHDIIEDTSVTYESLRDSFGVEVAGGVMALTKDARLPTKADQMRNSLSRIQLQPKEIWMVKMADRITNLQPPPGHWRHTRIKHYHEEAIQIYETLREANDLLAHRLWQKAESYKRHFEKPKTRSS